MSDLSTLRERLARLVAFWRGHYAGRMPVYEVEALLKEPEVRMSDLSAEQIAASNSSDVWIKKQRFHVQSGKMVDARHCYQEGWLARAAQAAEEARDTKEQLDAAEKAIMHDDLDLSKALHIEYCEDLIEEGSPWEVAAEPEPQYFATLKEAIVFLVNLRDLEAGEALRCELDETNDLLQQFTWVAKKLTQQADAQAKTILELQEWKASALLLMGNSIELMREMADRARAASVPSHPPQFALRAILDLAQECLDITVCDQIAKVASEALASVPSVSPSMCGNVLIADVVCTRPAGHGGTHWSKELNKEAYWNKKEGVPSVSPEPRHQHHVLCSCLPNVPLGGYGCKCRLEYGAASVSQPAALGDEYEVGDAGPAAPPPAQTPAKLFTATNRPDPDRETRQVPPAQTEDKNG